MWRHASSVPSAPARWKRTEETRGLSGGAVVTNGAFQLAKGHGLVSGKYRVEILAQKKTGKQTSLPPSSGISGTIEETVEMIPARYNTQSTLTCELKAGENVLDFNLTASVR